MSTRSGKRIHSSFHENIIKKDVENAARSERKTRSKKVKENLEEPASVFKSKKRNNYVSYPTDDEGGTDIDHKEAESLPRSRKNALKERNTIHATETVSSEQKSVRTTRRTQKATESTEELLEAPEKSNKNEVQKVKSKKKKKSTESQETERTKKIKKKKKKGRRSSSMIVEDIEPEVNKSMLNKSSMSVDSFHSAAGSPQHFEQELPDDIQTVSSTPLNFEEENPGRKTRSGKVTKNESEKVSRKRKSSCITKDTSLDNDSEPSKDNKRHKKDITGVRNDTDTSVEDDTLTEQNVESTEKINTTFEKDFKDLNNSRRSTRKSNINATFEKIENMTETSRKSVINTTYDKDSDKRLSVKDSTFDKNATFDKDTFDKRKSVKDITFEKGAENNDATFDKDSKSTLNKRKSVKDTTFDKNGTFDKELESTFEKRKSVKDTTFEKDAESNDTTFDKDSNSTFDKKKSVKDTTFDKNGTFDKKLNSTFEKRKSVKDTTFDKDSNSTFDKTKTVKDTTFDKDLNNTFDKRKSVKDTAFDKNGTFEKSTTFDKNSTFDKKSAKDSTFDKDNASTVKDTTFEKDVVPENSSNTKDSTFDKNTTNNRKSIINITFEKDDIQLDTNKKTDTKLDTTFDKNSKSSLISSDNSNVTLDKSEISRISITSDDSKENIENIINTTPVLIESSIDESHILEKSPIIAKTPDTTVESPIITKTQDTTVKSPITPLKREGTFTKEEVTPSAKASQPDVLSSPVQVLKTPTRSQRRVSLPSPGCTPFPNKSQERILNITRSIERRRSSLIETAPRTTKVMFCSPVNNPAVVQQQRRKVIKSNLKGSNKSFVFDDSVIEPRPARKRSYTQSDAEDVKTKRTRLANDGQHSSVDRLSRSRTSSASAKLTLTTPKKSTPSRAKITRTKLPNFAILHQKRFDKMESLDECQERKAKRAKQLLTPTGPVTVLERSSVSPKEPEEKPIPQPSSEKPIPQPSTEKPIPQLSTEKPQASSSKKQTKEDPKKPETPIKSLPTLKSLNPGYSRFGFRLNLDVNPFTFTSKTDAVKPKEKRPNVTRQATVPSLIGATSSRREEAKKAIMREKLFTEKRNVNRNENRTIIKGVRTNRRFELQMRMRNVE